MYHTEWRNVQLTDFQPSKSFLTNKMVAFPQAKKIYNRIYFYNFFLRNFKKDLNKTDNKEKIGIE